MTLRIAGTPLRARVWGGAGGRHPEIRIANSDGRRSRLVEPGSAAAIEKVRAPQAKFPAELVLLGLENHLVT